MRLFSFLRLCGLALASAIVAAPVARAHPGAAAPSICPGFSVMPELAAAGAHYRPRYRTIAHRLLDDEKVAGEVTPQMYAFLDSLIDQARVALKPYPRHPTPEESVAYGREALAAIDCVLLVNGFVWPDTQVVLLSDALKVTTLSQGASIIGDDDRIWFVNTRRPQLYHFVDCDTGSFIYLAVAEVMHLPLSLVTVPKHAFVRWTADPAHRFDFETTRGATVEPGASGDIDANFVSYFDDDPPARDKQDALADMTQGNILSFHHVFIAQLFRDREARSKTPDFMLMQREFEAALRADPDSDWAYNELAWYHAVMRPEPGTRLLALRYSLRANELVKEPIYRSTLACVYAALGDFDKARRTELSRDEQRVLRDSDIGHRVIAKNTDEIAEGRRCSETLADYTAWGAP